MTPLWLLVAFATVFAPVNSSPVLNAQNCKNCYKVLSTDIKTAAKKSLTAVAQAGMDLTKMRIEFADQQFNLEANLKKAKEMAEGLRVKIDQSVKEVKKILEKATKDAKAKMAEVLAASDALGALEKKVDAKQVSDKAKKIRQMTKGKPIKSKIAKKIMNENGIITKLNAAKILAKTNAKNKETKIEKSKQAVRDDIARMEKSMTIAENQFNSEEEKEIQSERSARSKIQEAVKHNQAALKKAKIFLLSVEKGIEKFDKDIKEIPLN